MRQVKFILPRAIYGNRGDLASRWGVLAGLHQLGVDDALVFHKLPGDVPTGFCSSLPYGKGRNLLLPAGVWRLFYKPNVILWAAGLDFQDDSSLAKLLYLWLIFSIYRARGLKVVCLFQGAGPLKTKPGRWLAAQALKQVNLFIARDPGTEQLIRTISPATRVQLAHDAIFLPGFEQEVKSLPASDRMLVDEYIGEGTRPVIGINLRQWFHFSSSLLPYQMNKSGYQQKSTQQMEKLLTSMATVIRFAREKWKARILLISAYQPDVLPWEDDLPWMEKLACQFSDDPQVVLTNKPLTMLQYYALMSRLDVMIGMRLHSSLIALRMAVPSINISYTLKGRDILEYMGLGSNVVDLTDFLADPKPTLGRMQDLLDNLPESRKIVQARTDQAIQENMRVLSSLLQELRAGL
ncbi:MAG: hypothetical protein C0391_07240 [Anaerolinea sp.]|nr:hypothetical protein [Anaerolinea sp.]